MKPDVPVLKRKREPSNELAPFIVDATPTVMPPEPEFDWRRTLGLLLARKRFVLLWILAMLVLGVLVLLLYPPTYKADGVVQIQLDKDSTRPANVTGDQSISYDITGNSMLTDGEIAVMQSRLVLLDVIKTLNLLVDARPNTFPIVGGAIYRFNSDSENPIETPDILRHFAWGGEHIDVKTFDVPSGLKNKKFLLRATEGGYDLIDPDGNVTLKGQVGKLATHGRISILVNRLSARWGTTFKLVNLSLQEELERFSNALTAEEKVKDSGVITLTFKGNDPAVVAAVINNIEDIYLKKNIEWKAARAEELEQALRSQLPHLREQVEYAQEQLNAYQTKHGSVDVTTETQLLLQHGVELETNRLSLTQQREEAVQRFTDRHPMVASIDSKIASIDAELQKIKLQSTKLPLTQQELLNRSRDLDLANQLYTAMLNTIQQQEVIQAGALGSSRGNVRIVDAALIPEKPSFPKLKMVVPAAIVLGALFGSGWLLSRHFFVNPLHDESELAIRFGLKVLGRIPFSRAQKKLNKRRNKRPMAVGPLAMIASQDPAMHALRALRNSLHYATSTSRNKVIVVAGPMAGTGKSFLALNLAALLALSGKRTVIIDADLVNGTLFESLGLESSPGLTDYIMEAVAPGAIIQATQIAGLTLISQGSRRSEELLLDDMFAKLLDFLGSRYDHIIIDTPDNLTDSHAGAVARLAGCTLMALRSGVHPIEEIEESFLRLTYAGATVRGVIFNSV